MPFLRCCNTSAQHWCHFLVICALVYMWSRDHFCLNLWVFWWSAVSMQTLMFSVVRRSREKMGAPLCYNPLSLGIKSLHQSKNARRKLWLVFLSGLVNMQKGGWLWGESEQMSFSWCFCYLHWLWFSFSMTLFIDQRDKPLTAGKWWEYYSCLSCNPGVLISNGHQASLKGSSR